MNPQTLTRAQLAALIVAKGYKPFARQDNARRETGITAEAYAEAVAALNAQGLYLKRSAITEAGRAVVDGFASEHWGSDGKLAALRPADYKRWA